MSNELTPQNGHEKAVTFPVLAPEVLAELSKPTPKEKIKSIDKGGKTFSYVDPNYVVQRLNAAFTPLGWSSEAEVVSPWELVAKSKQIVVKVKLTVNLPDGRIVVKEQFGAAEVKFFKDGSGPLSVGDDAKAAASDGLKKCASLLGIASDVYSGDAKAEPHGTPSQSSGPAPSSGSKKIMPRDPGAPATDKQKGLIKYLAEKKGLDIFAVSEKALEISEGERDIDGIQMGDVDPLLVWINSQ